MTTGAEILYYLPAAVSDWVGAACPEQADTCDVFSLLGGNSCIIDRTGCIELPFAVRNLYPIPDPVSCTRDFAELCLERAQNILAENKPVYLLYSGGLDSTTMLMAFHHEIQTRRLDPSQLIITTSLDAVGENSWAWQQIVLPHYKLAVTDSVLDSIDMSHNRYVQGENADQLFGSDQIFSEPHLISQEFDADALRDFICGRVQNPRSQARLHHQLSCLAERCPLPLHHMRDFLWWLNFSCKWQCVSLRTLIFSSVFVQHQTISQSSLGAFETFFNTVEFQQLALSGSLRRWGDHVTPYTYKQAARDFILKMGGQREWTQRKVKVGSLYNIMKQRSRAGQSIVLENSQLRVADLLTVAGSSRF